MDISGDVILRFRLVVIFPYIFVPGNGCTSTPIDPLMLLLLLFCFVVSFIWRGGGECTSDAAPNVIPQWLLTGYRLCTFNDIDSCCSGWWGLDLAVVG